MSSNKYFAKRLTRSALAIALGVCFAGGVSAQSSVGSIFGNTTANTAVTVENLDTGSTRQSTTDGSGRFSFAQLTPGRYRVTSEGVTREVLVKLGTGTEVRLAAADPTTLDAVTVVGSASINPIDVSSVESTTVFTAEQIANLPVASDITAVALLAPGTVKGDTGFGNLASFGGASVAENGYYINGFDVTNMRNMLSFADLPFQAIAQQQVKTGGYGAEYGRSLGGVISLLTKAGSNEWKFGGAVEWAPSSLREPGKDVVSRNTDAGADDLFVYRSDNESDRLTYSAYVSGPIIKDRLFVFAMIEGRDNTTDTYGSTTSNRQGNDDPQAIVKLDWNITDNHVMEFTGIYNKNRTQITTYRDFSGNANTGQHGDVTETYEVENGGEIGILKYTGYLTDNFTISAQYGYLTNMISSRLPANGAGSECPWAYNFGLTTSVLQSYVGCNTAGIATINDLNAEPDEDTRKAYRIDAEWQLGDHRVRFGVDRESYVSTHRGQTYAGGINWAYYTVPGDAVSGGLPGRIVNGVRVAPGAQYARSRFLQTSSSAYENINSAIYLEDSWNITDNFLAYVGLRWEKFQSNNGDGIAWVESDYELAPRLGFSWDMFGDSTVKVYGNAGRYYIPVATNSSIRATGSEYLEFNWYYVTGWDPNTGLPTGQGAQIGSSQINGSLEAPNPASVASTNLSPMYQDEFILGAQFQVNDLWTLGVRGISREVKSGMDDACTHQPFLDWAEDEGLTNFDVDSVPSCFFINPGSDVIINADTDGDGDVELAEVPASYFGLPEYRRTYHALEITAERATEKFQFQGSYTFSKSKGNIEGYVNSTLEQDDPGLTQDFDHSRFMDGAFGYLPNDRTHTLKLFGVYKFSDQWQVGGNFVAQTGRPVNCQGYIPLEGTGIDEGTLTPYSGSSFYCLNDDAVTRTLTTRGSEGRTPSTWVMDLSAAYIPNWAGGKLKFKVDAFNIFNNDKVLEYNEFKEASRNVLDPDYLNDVNYQTPRSVRFTVRYDF
jgi:hypothetical protein